MYQKTMKKVTSVVMTACLAVTMLAGISVTTYAFSGSGTESSPYLISSQDDLEAITDFSKYYQLTQSITLDDTWSGLGSSSISSSASTYSPYESTGAVAFSGTLDGAGYTITLTRSVSSSGQGGIVNYLGPSGTVKNLNVSGLITITAGVDAIGGVVGYNSGTINNVTSSVNIQTSNNSIAAYNIGGIAGFNNGYYTTSGAAATSGLSGIIVNSANSGAIKGYSKVGGITGENSGTVSFCNNTGSVTCTCSGSKTGAGGIAGRNGNNNTAREIGIIKNCYNRGSISVGTGKWCGGITGFNNGKSVVLNCYNTASSFTANSYKNPIIGNNENTTQISEDDNYTSVNTGTGSAVEKGSYRTDMASNNGAFLGVLNTNAIPDNVWAYSDSINDGYPYRGSLASVPAPSSYGAMNSYSVIYLGGSNASDSNAGNVSTAPLATLNAAVTKAGNSTVSTVYIAVQGTVEITGAENTFGRNISVKWSSTSSSGPMFKVMNGGSLAVGGLTFDGQYSYIDGDNNTVTVNVDKIFEVQSGGSIAIRYNTVTTNCGIAVDASGGGNVTICRCTLGATNYSVKVGGTCSLRAGSSQSITISAPIYLVEDKYLTIDSTLTSNVYVVCENPVCGSTLVASVYYDDNIIESVDSYLKYSNNTYGISSSTEGTRISYCIANNG